MPTERLQQRFPRTLSNLRAAIRELPKVLILEDDNLSKPFRKVVESEHVQMIFRAVAGRPSGVMFVDGRAQKQANRTPAFSEFFSSGVVNG